MNFNLDIFFSYLLHRPIFLKYNSKSLHQNLNIQPDTPLLDILRVKPYNFLEIGDFAAAADLPHTCYAGLCCQAGTVVKVVLFNFVLRWGTCA